MTPNADNYNPSTEYAKELIEKIGKSQVWIAKRLGVSDRRIRYIVNGSRIVNGETIDVKMSYTEQFAMECLAEAVRQASEL